MDVDGDFDDDKNEERDLIDAADAPCAEPISSPVLTSPLMITNFFSVAGSPTKGEESVKA